MKPRCASASWLTGYSCGRKKISLALQLSLEKRILVVGYPKSGNTWLTKLVAALVDCPSKGYLEQDERIEISQEGLNRNSNYECWKSHHMLHELQETISCNDKIIYIVRDPRDLAISATHYLKSPPIQKALDLGFKKHAYSSTLYETFVSVDIKLSGN